MNIFIEAAIAQAQKGIRKNQGGPFGAVVVRNGQIVAEGHSEVVGAKDPTAHAEMVAIRLAAKKLKRFDLSDCEIYTTCEPCPMCLGAILWARIGKVHFGCTKEDAREIGFDDVAFYKAFEQPSMSPLIKWFQTDRDECKMLFSEWSSKADKTPY